MAGSARLTAMNTETATTKPNAIGYVRVSTQGQADGGVSLDAQRTQLAQWAAREGLVIEVYADEGKSGKSRKGRPGLAAAIAHAKRDRLPMVVWNLSRLSRSTRDCLDIAAELQGRKAQLVLLCENIDTRTASGEFAFTMFAAVAQAERRRIADATKEGLRELRSQGRRWNHDAPYGFEFAEDGRVVECPEEQWVLAAIRELRTRGMSYRRIAAELESRNVAGRSGRPMKFQTIERICNREPVAVAA